MAHRTPNIEDVARLAGVSRAAVSKVLRDAYGVSDEMRRVVSDAIAELNYRPRVGAQAMRGRSHTIGFVLPSLGSPFFSEIFEGAEDELVGTRYRIIVATSQHEDVDDSAAVQNLVDRQVDGVVVLSPLTDISWLERTAQRVPMAVLARHDHSEHFDTIAGDDRRGAQLVVDHLVGLGHTRIAHIAHAPESPAPVLGAPHAVRAAGYLDAMRAHGLDADAQLLYARFEEEPAYQATLDAMNSSTPPTAIFAGADAAAFGALRALEELPRQKSESVAVIGYDNTRLAAHPRMSLSSIDQGGREMGRRAAAHVLSRIAGRTAAIQETLEPHLVVRHSSVAISGVSS